MPTLLSWMMGLALLVIASPAFAQDVAPEVPGFLMTFAAGHWWIVPAYGLLVMVVAALDATFFTEDFKAKWPKLLRTAWNWVALNVGKSKNQGSAD